MNHSCYLNLGRLLLLCQLVLSALLLPSIAMPAAESKAQQAEPEKGPQGGRLLRDGEFAVELVIFETGVPPEYRAWITDNGQPVRPDAVSLTVRLDRLGNVVDEIGFSTEDGYLRGDTVIYEPHSFVVTLTAQYQGKTHRWQFESFEGRTRINDSVAAVMGIATETAGSATLHQTIRTYGKLVLPPDARRRIQARFDGVVKAMHVRLGDAVSQGQKLATIESNESLQTYSITAPMAGVISEQFASAGEQTAGRVLLEIMRTDTLLAELAVYPADRDKVHLDAPVTVSMNGVDEPVQTRISRARTGLRTDQARLFLAELDNEAGLLSEGLFIVGDIEVATIPVPLAVKRSGLQPFRDFTVVFAKVGEDYEVRMLELGREAGPWVEVLGGLTRHRVCHREQLHHQGRC